MFIKIDGCVCVARFFKSQGLRIVFYEKFTTSFVLMILFLFLLDFYISILIIRITLKISSYFLIINQEYYIEINRSHISTVVRLKYLARSR